MLDVFVPNTCIPKIQSAPRRAQPCPEGGASADCAAHGGGDAGRRLEGRGERTHDDPGYAPCDAADEARDATLVNAPVCT